MPTGYTDFYRGLFITIESILTGLPVDGEVSKAPTSDWAFDHAENPTAHQTPGEVALGGGFMADSYDSELQGTFAYSAVPGGMFSKGMYNISANDGDGVQWFGRIGIGTYEMCIAYYRHTGAGIMKFAIGASIIDITDMWGAAAYTINKFQFQITGNEGFYPFKFYIDGKNPSSTGYWMFFYYWSLTKSA
ncbi:hypothetical protein LCGC14_1513540 [marine sediment metagenome]|uniref:Uncharacterized protein n=1 Tax=marine sediment metagenome TaxID=412755 RepID=A0A0F9M1T7_9ZZZZ